MIKLHQPALLTLIVALGAAPATLGQAKSAVKGAAIQVSVLQVVDHRTSSDFPWPRLEMNLKLEGADANAVQAARARLSKAEDDTGRDLIKEQSERWQERRGNEPPALEVELASPARKARKLTAVEGMVEAYLPSRDPASLVKIEKIMSKKDKPSLAVPALAKEKIKLQVLSKEGLEKEKRAAEAKKKAEAAKRKKDGLEEMADTMADGLVSLLERLFMVVGEHDLVLKVDDPEKKIFSFGLVGPDGTPLPASGTMEMESYQIVKNYEPVPVGAMLEVRLKTAKSFVEVPFKLTDVKLP